MKNYKEPLTIAYLHTFVERFHYCVIVSRRAIDCSYAIVAVYQIVLLAAFDWLPRLTRRFAAYKCWQIECQDKPRLVRFTIRLSWIRRIRMSTSSSRFFNVNLRILLSFERNFLVHLCGYIFEAQSSVWAIVIIQWRTRCLNVYIIECRYDRISYSRRPLFYEDILSVKAFSEIREIFTYMCIHTLMPLMTLKRLWDY